ncbi:MAG: hypothetical protein ACRDRA_04195 [Pseudonocardiaceae bacterium]
MAHPDDAELWAGGTLAMHAQAGAPVTIAVPRTNEARDREATADAQRRTARKPGAVFSMDRYKASSTSCAPCNTGPGRDPGEVSPPHPVHLLPDLAVICPFHGNRVRVEPSSSGGIPSRVATRAMVTMSRSCRCPRRCAARPARLPSL